jgi:hypothetical protein
MKWKIVRLELDRTPTFPNGSPGRAYLLRVPLDEDGRIDGTALAKWPTRATARRFWSSDPDRFGHVEASDGHFVFRCRSAQGESLSRMPALPFRLDGRITIDEPDGTSNRFRVASIKTGILAN